jgi:predicted dehydrogenase
MPTLNLVKSNQRLSPIRVAMIGGGINSAIGRVHEIAMKMDGRFKLVAGCFSRDPLANRQSAEQYGIDKTHVYGSIESLLDAEAHSLDAVVVATPVRAHYDHIVEILDRGICVISDKPLADSPAKCAAIRRRAEEMNANVYCIFNYTGYPAVREIRERVRSGSIGKVFKIMAEMPQDSYLRLANQGRIPEIQQWRLQDGEIACVTLDLFIHLHSLVAFICDARPIEVTAHTRSISGVAQGLIDEVDALIHYDDSMVVSIWYGKAVLGYRNGLRIRIFGTDGSLQWYQTDPEAITGSDAAGNPFVIDRLTSGADVMAEARYQRFKAGHPAGFIEAFANYYCDIADSMGIDQPLPCLIPLDVVEEGLSIALAIHESSARRSPFRIPRHARH